MNVYVREITSSLSRAGVECEVFTKGVRRSSLVESAYRLTGVGGTRVASLAKEDLPDRLDQLVDEIEADLRARPVDALYAHYWISGLVGVELKSRLGVPLVTTFHTLGRVKSLNGDPESPSRIAAEDVVVQHSDLIAVSSRNEAAELVEHYGASGSKLEVIPPGVEHAIFSPGPQFGARQATGLPPVPIVLFVGRIQPLKGLDVAIGACSQASEKVEDLRLVVIGGPSGQSGALELSRCQSLATDLGYASRVSWVSPQPHHLLSSFYRSADLCVVPSRSESFGLVALESSACGVPVVATDVGGLSFVIERDRTGILVQKRSANAFGLAIAGLLADDPRRSAMGRAASERARGFSWTLAAGRLRRLLAQLTGKD